MIGLGLLVRRLGRAARHAFGRPEFRALLGLVGLLIAAGMFFYRRVEDFGWIDSLYFSVITLTTVGYGDLHPATAAGKLFTAGYVLIGVGVLVAFVTEIASSLMAVQRAADTDD